MKRKPLAAILTAAVLCAGMHSMPASAYVIPGDLDGSGGFALNDLVVMQKYLLGLSECGSKIAADLNHDNDVDIFDLALMKNRIFRLPELSAFAPGLWWVTGSGADRYVYLDADCRGYLRYQETGAVVPVEISFSGAGTYMTYDNDRSEPSYIEGALTAPGVMEVIYEDLNTERWIWTAPDDGLFPIYSNDELCSMSLDYYERKTGYRPEFATADIMENGWIAVQLYDLVDDHTSTSDWYFLDRFTGTGYNFTDEPVDLSGYLQ